MKPCLCPIPNHSHPGGRKHPSWPLGTNSCSTGTSSLRRGIICVRCCEITVGYDLNPGFEINWVAETTSFYYFLKPPKYPKTKLKNPQTFHPSPSPCGFICWVVKSAFPSLLWVAVLNKVRNPGKEEAGAKRAGRSSLPHTHPAALRPLASPSRLTVWAAAQTSKGVLTNNKPQLCWACGGNAFWSSGISSENHLCLPASCLAWAFWHRDPCIPASRLMGESEQERGRGPRGLWSV